MPANSHSAIAWGLNAIPTGWNSCKIDASLCHSSLKTKTHTHSHSNGGELVRKWFIPMMLFKAQRLAVHTFSRGSHGAPIPQPPMINEMMNKSKFSSLWFMLALAFLFVFNSLSWKSFQFRFSSRVLHLLLLRYIVCYLYLNSAADDCCHIAHPILKLCAIALSSA